MLRQFPDCRFVYAFFRARTLGYDVYPEDHFLQNFPWQLYGGLWSCDDARFARAEPMNALTALALRRITSEGSAIQLPREILKEVIFGVDIVSEGTNTEEGVHEATVGELTKHLKRRSLVKVIVKEEWEGWRNRKGVSVRLCI